MKTWMACVLVILCGTWIYIRFRYPWSCIVGCSQWRRHDLLRGGARNYMDILRKMTRNNIVSKVQPPQLHAVTEYEPTNQPDLSEDKKSLSDSRLQRDLKKRIVGNRGGHLPRWPVTGDATGPCSCPYRSVRSASATFLSCAPLNQWQLAYWK